MSKSRRPGKRAGMSRLRIHLDQTRLPQWLVQPWTPHEIVYNPTIKAGLLRRMLIQVTAAYPKTCFLLLLAAVFAAWVAFLVFSRQQLSDALFALSLFELPFVAGLTMTLWPMVLYRLYGLPRPAARPYSRSAKQRSARAYYRGSYLTFFFLFFSAAIAWLWWVILAFSQSGGNMGAWMIFAISLLALPILAPFVFIIARGIKGVSHVKPVLPSTEQGGDLLPENTAGSRGKRRRRKTRKEGEQAMEQEPPEGQS